MRVGVLTGGGDCPGLNAVIRAIVRKGETHYGDEIIGFVDAWDGVMDAHARCRSTSARCAACCRRAARCSAPGGAARSTAPTASPLVKATFEEMGLDALIVIGGNGSLTVVAPARASSSACRSSACPRRSTTTSTAPQVTFGFHTAVQIATDAIDRLHTTAESHDRVMVVEVMGRHAGWIATYAGIAGGATVILIPEQPFDIDEVCAHPRSAATSAAATPRSWWWPRAPSRSPARSTLEERADDRFGHVRLGGIAYQIAPEIEARTGFETRVVMLGHVQRGGTPCAYDRVLSTRYGLAAIDAVHERGVGRDGGVPRAAHRAGADVGVRRAHPHARHGHVPRRRRGLLRLTRTVARTSFGAAPVATPPTSPSARPATPPVHSLSAEVDPGASPRTGCARRGGGLGPEVCLSH